MIRPLRQAVAPGQRSGWWAGATLIALMLLISVRGGAEAHAFLERSDPLENAVVPSVPADARLWFTEPIERQYAHAQLFDVRGQRIETPAAAVDPDDSKLMVLPLPSDLQVGTYTISWQNISAADGHPADGLLTFTIGSQQDVEIAAPPKTPDFGGPPTYVEAIGRWLSLLGATSMLGILVTGFWVVEPSIGGLTAASRRKIGAALRTLLLASIVVTLVGAAIVFVDQLLTVEAEISGGAITRLIIESEFGRLWLIRVELPIVLGAHVLVRRSWILISGRASRIVSISLATGTLMSFALGSHAAGLERGRGAAVLADLFHMLAASLWVGGLLALTVAVFMIMRMHPADLRRQFLVMAIPRFSTLGIVSVVILSGTGLYAAWLQVGNLYGLTETDYGRTLLIKLVLVAGMLVLGAVNLFVIQVRVRRNVEDGSGLRRTVAVEATFGVAVLLLTGILISLPTARSVTEAETGRTVSHITQDNIHVTLYVSPGVVGLNRYTAVFDQAGNEQLAEGSVVLLRASTEGAVSGVREIELENTAPDTFEAVGSELSVVGDWGLELILRRPNQSDWRVSTTMVLREVSAEERVPGPSPRIVGRNGFVWLVVVMFSIPIIVVSARHEQSLLPVAAGGVMLVAGLAGLFTSYEMVGRADEAASPIPATQASISLGAGLFQENCVRCHGTDATGSGPVLAGQNNPNADLTARHVGNHSQRQLHDWIRDGIGGTLMPTFGNQLTDDEIWHLVNYIQTLRSQ